jgi:ABC-type antimicrobial peptide transport system permease subunit
MLIASEQDISSRLYLAIMLVCMLLSGLAIVNTMLIAVLERAREIAIRRVEGARRRDIAAQFVTETALMCVIGAIIGMPVGLGLAWANIILRPRFHTLSAVGLPWGVVLPIIGAALVVGVLAGLLPARRAAKVDPVVTLSRSA